jgi:bifunctional DNA-binding transcriptional regulator/antitoxin component of YhaV-PrlF toxin-antitoxin module
MTQTGDLHVSSRGQMSLPATARRRWGLDVGGEVGYLDLGDAVVLVPGGIEALRSSLLDTLTDDDWKRVRNGFGDSELANE